MKEIFADSQYWIAVADPLDQWHESAKNATRDMGEATFVTTDEVLVEFLNSFCGGGAYLREAAARFIYRLRQNPTVLVVEQSRFSFDGGLIVYDKRHDKGYSFVDCVSMNTMHKMCITKILTHDRHFVQEGFEILIS